MSQMIVYGILQLVMIVLAGILGFHFTREYSLIPKAIIHLPDVYVSHSDYIQVLTIFFIGYILQLIASNLIYKQAAFSSLKRFMNEYIHYLFAYTTVSLYIFLATTINYDPQFIAAVGLFSTVLYWILGVIILVHNKESGVAQFFGTLIKRFLSVSGVLALVYFLVPLGLGKAFSSDRDIANKITQVRIWFNPVAETDWGFKNFIPGQVFHQPVLAKQAPDDDNNIYVLERFGKIYKINAVTEAKPELMLDISSELGEVEVENGAVGLAFHPAFNFNHTDSRKPYIYVYFTDTRPTGYQRNRLTRYDLSQQSLEERNNSGQTVLDLHREDSGFHNGGSVEFGPDGFLYVALGEGVHPKVAKSYQETMRSGILRIDVDMNEELSNPAQPFKHGVIANYMVPKDNPFIGREDIRHEYWALGLRNPFRISFDVETNDLWVGDVGSTVWEEINLVEKGFHYEFPKIEGDNDKGTQANDLGLPDKGPVYTYQHTAYDRAVIGGVVNRSDNYDQLKGKYIFADNYSAKIFAFDAASRKVENVEFLARANQYAQRGVSSVTQLRGGEILITTLGAASEPSGEVLQLVKASEATVTVEEGKEEEIPKDYDEQITSALFNVNCARCHGVKGDGDSPDAAHLGVALPDFTSPLYHFKTSKKQMLEVVNKGGAQTGKSPLMPPWQGFLKPHEIEHLIIYIESLPAKHHHH